MKFYLPVGCIFCKDGARLSIQANKNAYCLPREDAEETYTHLEVGFPSINPPVTWEEYADGTFPSDIYAYVPAELIESYIRLHGGIDIGKTIASMSKQTMREVKI